MVPRKIPKQDFVVQVIIQVLKNRKFVETQEDLCFHVLKKLKKYDADFVLSPQRVKILALKIPGIEIKAKTKRMPKMIKLTKCPVCGKRIKKIFGKNLLNKKIHVGYVCRNCGYTADLEALMPMKYIFIWKE